jgi:hypothetical protein
MTSFYSFSVKYDFCLRISTNFAYSLSLTIADMRLYEVIYTIVAVLMTVVYCVIGVLMASQKVFFDKLSAEVNIVIGVAFFAYGLFRGWRTYQQMTNFREN